MERMASAMLLQLVKGAEHGVYAAGERRVMVGLKGDWAREEEWASFRPGGVNEDAWNALSKSHRVWSGTFRWEWNDFIFLLPCMAGTPTESAEDAGVTTDTYELPAFGERTDITPFFVEYGERNRCDRCGYGLILSLSRSNNRDGQTVEGQISILCQRPADDAVDIPMTGWEAANQKYDITLAVGETGAGTISVADADGVAIDDVVITPGDSNATIKAALEALDGITTVVMTNGPIAANTIIGVTMASAGTSYVNGAYVPNGTSGGAVKYEKGGGYATLNGATLQFNGSTAWQILGATGAVLYAATGTSGAVPTSGWSNSGGTGTNPAPTLTLSYTNAGATVSVEITSPANTRFRFSTETDGWSVEETQRGTAAENVIIPARVPFLVQQQSHRRAAALADVSDATPINKAKGMTMNLSGLVEPVWFANENELTYESHVDGAEPRKEFSLVVAEASSDMADLVADAEAQPATPQAFEHRDAHADGEHVLKIQHYSSMRGAIPYGAAGNVRTRELPLGPVLDSAGNSVKFIVSYPTP